MYVNQDGVSAGFSLAPFCLHGAGNQDLYHLVLTI